MLLPVVAITIREFDVQTINQKEKEKRGDKTEIWFGWKENPIEKFKYIGGQCWPNSERWPAKVEEIQERVLLLLGLKKSLEFSELDREKNWWLKTGGTLWPLSSAAIWFIIIGKKEMKKLPWNGSEKEGVLREEEMEILKKGIIFLFVFDEIWCFDFNFEIEFVQNPSKIELIHFSFYDSLGISKLVVVIIIIRHWKRSVWNGKGIWYIDSLIGAYFVNNL